MHNSYLKYFLSNASYFISGSCIYYSKCSECVESGPECAWCADEVNSSKVNRFSLNCFAKCKIVN